MSGRTFVVGDIHGDLAALRALVAKMPTLEAGDTLVFLGDYLDRGPHSAEVIEVVRGIERNAAFKVVCLRGNHEDAWVRVLDRRWDEFVFPPSNGCLATMRSYTGGPVPAPDAFPTPEELDPLFKGAFFPEDVVAWMRALPFWYEDEHGLYVHAGLIERVPASAATGRDGRFLHPRETEPANATLWTRSEAFFREYRGKRVIVGHTVTECLPPELSSYTPADPTDMWAGECVVAIDTGAGKDGFLTAIELPALRVWESR
ncbi:MAG: serine/threonine protein phosphatase [Deltaproteobacteria bacterium]|nr:serine/threonine protein phosphatase [Deltaproteobacteria bacterium]